MISSNKYRINFYHDYFNIRGGGEAVSLYICKKFHNINLYSFCFNHKLYSICEFPKGSNFLFSSAVGKNFIRIFGFLYFLILSLRFRRNCSHINIFSGVISVFAAPKSNKKCVNIFYCHTPPRSLFDRYEESYRTMATPLKFIFYLSSWLFKKFYRKKLLNMDVIICNSENTASRLKKYLSLDCLVVYPPLVINKYPVMDCDCQVGGDYFLSFARLEPLKRVESIIQAFIRLPSEKLVVASSGSLYDILFEKYSKFSNIIFTGWVSDRKMADLVACSRATVYIPVDEDFGMSPIESMAAGKPVLGVNEGGLRETLLHRQTGFLVESDFNVTDLVNGVKYLSKDTCLNMKTACIMHSENFSSYNFDKNFFSILCSFIPEKDVFKILK